VVVSKLWRQWQGLEAVMKRSGEVLLPAVYPPPAHRVSPCAINVCAIKAGAGSLWVVGSGGDGKV
jgi:hypothetical protein